MMRWTIGIAEMIQDSVSDENSEVPEDPSTLQPSGSSNPNARLSH